MKVLAVDDEHIGLLALKNALVKADEDLEIVGFSDPEDALEYLKNNSADAVFTDISMGATDGLAFAEMLKKADPEIRVVFVSGYDEYMKDAFLIHADGYVLKPVTPEKMAHELTHLRSLVKSAEKKADKAGAGVLDVKCFGNFDVYFDGKPLHFKYDKTKEMLAYIISRRGSLCSNGEITCSLWEDDGNHDSYLRGLRKDMMDVLKSLNLEDAVFQQRGKLGINEKFISCDYYDYLERKPGTEVLYKGEFMNQYSWAEDINGRLTLETGWYREYTE